VSWIRGVSHAERDYVYSIYENVAGGPHSKSTLYRQIAAGASSQVVSLCYIAMRPRGIHSFSQSKSHNGKFVKTCPAATCLGFLSPLTSLVLPLATRDSSREVCAGFGLAHSPPQIRQKFVHRAHWRSHGDVRVRTPNFWKYSQFVKFCIEIVRVGRNCFGDSTFYSLHKISSKISTRKPCYRRENRAMPP